MFELEKHSKLKDIALLFLKLGATSFGGPAAHIAMMEEEVVRKRNWITREDFLDLLGATNFIPGPNSTEMAIHIGHRRAGLNGLVVAGTCFILPAVLIVSILAWAYVRYGTLPSVEGLLYGVRPVIVAIVLMAGFSLGKSAIKDSCLAVIGILALIASARGIPEIAIVFFGGLANGVGKNVRRGPKTLGLALTSTWLLPGQATGAGTMLAGAAPTVQSIFYVFLKMGSVLFGSGYVLLSYLRSDLVEGLHWLTEAQLLDATAIGQFTPGPLFTTATFIGHLLAGPGGALAATIGIFLPAFVFVALSAPLLPKLSRVPHARAILDGINVASLALIATVAWHLGKASLVDIPTIGLALAALLLQLKFKLNSAWLVLGGALSGLFIH